MYIYKHIPRKKTKILAKILLDNANKLQGERWIDKLAWLTGYCEDHGCYDCIFGRCIDDTCVVEHQAYKCIFDRNVTFRNDPEDYNEEDYIDLLKILSPDEVARTTCYKIKY